MENGTGGRVAQTMDLHRFDAAGAAVDTVVKMNVTNGISHLQAGYFLNFLNVLLEVCISRHQAILCGSIANQDCNIRAQALRCIQLLEIPIWRRK